MTTYTAGEVMRFRDEEPGFPRLVDGSIDYEALVDRVGPGGELMFTVSMAWELGSGRSGYSHVAMTEAWQRRQASQRALRAGVEAMASEMNGEQRPHWLEFGVVAIWLAVIIAMVIRRMIGVVTWLG